MRSFPVVVTVAAITLLEAATFAVGAVAHTGTPLSIGALRLEEPRILPATIVESLAAVGLIGGAAALLTGRRWGWRALVAGHFAALAAVVLGMFALALGAGPRTAANEIYHRTILIVVAIVLIAVRRPTLRRRLQP